MRAAFSLTCWNTLRAVHRLPGLRRDSRSPAMVPCQSTIAAAAVAVLTVAAISAATAFAAAVPALTVRF